MSLKLDPVYVLDKYSCTHVENFPKVFFKSVLNRKVNSPIMTTMQNGCTYLLFYIKLLVKSS